MDMDELDLDSIPEIGAEQTSPSGEVDLDSIPEVPSGEVDLDSIPEVGGVNVLEPGNLSHDGRKWKFYRDEHGKINGYGTTRSMYTDAGGGRFAVIPTIVDGNELSHDEAVERYRKTGQHWGIVGSEDDARRLSQDVHNVEQSGNQLAWNRYIHSHWDDMSDEIRLDPGVAAEHERIARETAVESPLGAFMNELGSRLLTGGGIRENAEDSWMAKPYAYANDVANSVARGLVKVGPKIEEAVGNLLPGELGRTVAKYGRDSSRYWDAQLPNQAIPTVDANGESRGVADKVLQIGKNVGEVSAEFAPAAFVPGYAATIIGSGAINAYGETMDRAKAYGLSDDDAKAAALKAGGFDLLTNMLLMGQFKGMFRGSEQWLKRYLAETAKTSGIMGAQAFGNRTLENEISGRPIYEGAPEAGARGSVEGMLFHVVNHAAHAAPRVFSDRPGATAAERLAHDPLNSMNGRMILAQNSPQATEAMIQARIAGRTVTEKMLSDIGIPSSMAGDQATRDRIADAFIADRRIVRGHMDVMMKGQDDPSVFRTSDPGLWVPKTEGVSESQKATAGVLGTIFPNGGVDSVEFRNGELVYHGKDGTRLTIAQDGSTIYSTRDEIAEEHRAQTAAGMEARAERKRQESEWRREEEARSAREAADENRPNRTLVIDDQTVVDGYLDKDPVLSDINRRLNDTNDATEREVLRKQFDDRVQALLKKDATTTISVQKDPDAKYEPQPVADMPELPAGGKEAWPEYKGWLAKTGKADSAKNWNLFVASNELDPALKVDTKDTRRYEELRLRMELAKSGEPEPPKREPYDQTDAEGREIEARETRRANEMELNHRWFVAEMKRRFPNLTDAEIEDRFSVARGNYDKRVKAWEANREGSEPTFSETAIDDAANPPPAASAEVVPNKETTVAASAPTPVVEYPAESTAGEMVELSSFRGYRIKGRSSVYGENAHKLKKEDLDELERRVRAFIKIDGARRVSAADTWNNAKELEYDKAVLALSEFEDAHPGTVSLDMISNGPQRKTTQSIKSGIEWLEGKVREEEAKKDGRTSENDGDAELDYRSWLKKYRLSDSKKRRAEFERRLNRAKSLETNTQADTPKTEADGVHKTGGNVPEAGKEAPTAMKTEHDFLRVMHDNQKPVRVPVGEISIPDTQFKEGADPKTGVVKGQELKGEYFESAENAVVVYVRKDGTKELVTGRHRFDLAKRNGKKDILARVFREADGYTPEDMRNLDAISNIIDEKGTEHDYIRYFENARPSRAAAEAAGFLSRSKGRLAFELYEGATEDTRAAIDWSGSGADGLISPEQAGIIAKAAPRHAHPRNGAVQRILVKKAQDGLRGDRLAILARSLAEEAKSQKAPAADGVTQLDLFTSEEDLALLAMEEKRAARRVQKANEYGRVAGILQTAMQKGGRLDLNKAYAKELGIKNPNDRKQLADARQKALEKEDYWRNAVRLDEADKAAIDAEINAAADDNAKKPAELKAKREAAKSGKPAPKPGEKPVASAPQKEVSNTPPKSDSDAMRMQYETILKGIEESNNILASLKRISSYENILPRVSREKLIETLNDSRAKDPKYAELVSKVKAELERRGNAPRSNLNEKVIHSFHGEPVYYVDGKPVAIDETNHKAFSEGRIEVGGFGAERVTYDFTDSDGTRKRAVFFYKEKKGGAQFAIENLVDAKEDPVFGDWGEDVVEGPQRDVAERKFREALGNENFEKMISGMERIRKDKTIRDENRIDAATNFLSEFSRDTSNDSSTNGSNANQRNEFVGVKPLPQTRENGPVSAPKEAEAITPPEAAKPNAAKEAPSAKQDAAADAATTKDQREAAIKAYRALGAEVYGMNVDQLEAALEKTRGESGPHVRPRIRNLETLIAYKKAVENLPEREGGEYRAMKDSESSSDGDVSDQKFLEWARRKNVNPSAESLKYYQAEQAEKATRLVRNFIPNVRFEFAKDAPKRGGAVKDESVQDLHDEGWNTVGEFNRKTGKVTLYPGATPETVMHELGGHALRLHAEQLARKGDRTLLDKLNQSALEAPEEFWNAVGRNYRGATPDEMVDEVYSHVFGRRTSAALWKALETNEGRAWYRKVWDAVKDVWRSIASKLGGNRVDLDPVKDMTPGETMDYIASQMLRGRTVGKIDMGTEEGTRRHVAGGAPAGSVDMDRSGWRRDRYMRNLADRFHDHLSLERDIESATGAPIPKTQSYYYAKRVQPGRDEASRIQVGAVHDKIADFLKGNAGNVSLADLDNYLYSRFAQQRNARLMKKRGVKDGAGVSDQWAKDTMQALRDSGKAQAVEDGVLKDIDAIRDASFDAVVESGLISRDEADRMRREEPDYVPLRTDYTDEDGFSRNMSRSVEAKTFKEAKGRTTEADSPTVMLLTQAMDNFARAHENESRRKLANLMRANPELGVRIVDGRDTASTEANDRYVVAFRENGVKKYIVFPSTDRGFYLAQAARGNGVVNFYGDLMKYLSMYAGMATRYSLSFSGANFFKDAAEVGMNTSSTEGLGSGGRFLKTQFSNWDVMPMMKRYFRTGEIVGPHADEFRLFAENGGLIGGASYEGFADVLEGLEAKQGVYSSGVSRAQGMIGAAFDATLGRMEKINEVVENYTRFNNFLNRLDGRKDDPEAVMEAVMASREDSTDFNMYGNKRWMNSVWQFSNSILGGTMRSARNLSMDAKSGRFVLKRKAAQTAAALFAIGMAEEFADWAVNHSSDEEDERMGLPTGMNISEYERANSLRLFRRGDAYVRLPVHGGPFSAIKYAGNNMARLMLGEISLKDAVSNTAREFKSFGLHFAGMGDLDLDVAGENAFKKAAISAAPVVFDTGAQLLGNMDYAGRPIYNDFDTKMPASSNGRQNTGPTWVEFAKVLNRMSGGDEWRKGLDMMDNPPEAYEYLVKQLGRNVIKDAVESIATPLVNAPAWAAGGFDREGGRTLLREFPVLNRFVKTVPENDARYQAAKRRHETEKAEFSRRPDDERRREIVRGDPHVAGKWNAKGTRLVASDVDSLIRQIDELRRNEGGLVRQWTVDSRGRPKLGEPRRVELTREQKARFSAMRHRLQAEVIRIMDGRRR